MYNANQIEKAQAHLTRTNRAATEATAPRHEAKNLTRPWRRWRVEGSSAGTSKIMGKATAERVASKYGGTVVDLKPPVVKAPKHSERPCPKCNAKIGKACKNASGGKVSAHAARKATAPAEAQQAP